MYDENTFSLIIFLEKFIHKLVKMLSTKKSRQGNFIACEGDNFNRDKLELSKEVLGRRRKRRNEGKDGVKEGWMKGRQDGGGRRKE